MSRRQEFIALPIHGLDEVSVQFMAQLVNDAGDPRPATIKRIRGGELIDLPLWKYPSGPPGKQMKYIELHRGQLYEFALPKHLTARSVDT